MLLQVSAWNSKTIVIINDKLVEGISYKQGGELLVFVALLGASGKLNYDERGITSLKWDNPRAAQLLPNPIDLN
jgi:hypothetical protein